MKKLKKNAPAIKTRKSKSAASEIPFSQYVEESMRKYQIEVITERAIPEVVDGLKPVQRRVVYAASKIAMTPVKTARLIGEVLGKYHPHGDSSVSDAIYTMVTKQPSALLRGVGNWGTLIDMPAAPRYTNVGLSAYGKLFVQSDYINPEVTPYVPNYDDQEIEPVVLPSMLPHILMIGTEGIAVGAATDIPAFTMESVVDLLIRILSGKRIGIKDFQQTLKLAFLNGGTLLNTPKSKAGWASLFTSSKGRLEFKGRIKVNEAKKHVVVSEWPPGLSPEKVMEKIRALPECGRVWTSEGAVTFTVPIKSGYTREQFLAFAEKIQKICYSANTYNMNVTIRKATIKDGVVEYDTQLKAMSVPQMMAAWLEARIKLELKSLNYRIKKQLESINYTELILWAIAHLDLLRDALKNKVGFKAYMKKHSKLSPDDIDILYGFTIGKLDALAKQDWASRLKEQQKVLAQLRKWKADPESKVLLDVKAIRDRLPFTEKEQKLVLA